MAKNGVLDTAISAWAGHSDLPFTTRVPVHPDPPGRFGDPFQASTRLLVFVSAFVLSDIVTNAV